MNVLIIEDEQPTAALLKEIVETELDFLVVKILDSIVDAVSYLARHQQNMDVIFMDIQLTDGYSFEIFKNVDIYVPVIFCTAYDDFTLKAIQNNGIDYILKPFEDAAIIHSLHKYKKMVDGIRSKNALQFQLPQTGKTQYQQSFLVQQREKSVVIPNDQIAHFSLEMETVYLYTFKSERFPVYKNMDYIESAIDPKLYFRINRQMIVHRNNVLSIEPFFNRKVFLHLHIQSNEKPIVSRLKVTAFKDWVEMG
ncbi:LytR/AlgR family response regulator transcription factor [Rhizosphaericola mali]|uniref:Response regulator transcription factor n=1 Tax=Rhizosphaericola mali TaxID=2545455 RepID=A0A5P2FX46_9BACT|nr:LytTR family DNA-binding domain-containing protein [Rhizosphaericola mali]QES88094.1 response regulator transcription factor [Rhizosphaericola mali]